MQAAPPDRPMGRKAVLVTGATSGMARQPPSASPRWAPTSRLPVEILNAPRPLLRTSGRPAMDGLKSPWQICRPRHRRLKLPIECSVRSSAKLSDTRLPRLDRRRSDGCRLPAGPQMVQGPWTGQCNADLSRGLCPPRTAGCRHGQLHRLHRLERVGADSRHEASGSFYTLAGRNSRNCCALRRLIADLRLTDLRCKRNVWLTL